MEDKFVFGFLIQVRTNISVWWAQLSIILGLEKNPGSWLNELAVSWSGDDRFTTCNNL